MHSHTWGSVNNEYNNWAMAWSVRDSVMNLYITCNCLYWILPFIVSFNTLESSGHIRQVPACNRGQGTLCMITTSVLYYWNITTRAQSYDIPSAVRSHYFADMSTSFRIYTFICQVFDKGASTTNLKFLFWLCVIPGHPI